VHASRVGKKYRKYGRGRNIFIVCMFYVQISPKKFFAIKFTETCNKKHDTTGFSKLFFLYDENFHIFL
jgi:hypothetical protein